MSKVSVILTSFNHGKQIHKTIDSILNQSYENFELLIWDDASTDNSWDIIESYEDSRIKIFRNEENRRGIWGLNKSISEMAEGEYIAVHHSGDEWHEDKLKLQVQALDNDVNIGAVFTKVKIIDEKGHDFLDKNNFYFDIFEQPNRTKHEWLRFFITKGNALCHPSALIRKSCFDDCGLYRNGLAQTGDFDMWLRLCLKHEILVLDEKLTYFRIESNDGNTSSHNKVTETRSFYECYRILSDLLGSLDELDWINIFPEYEGYEVGGGDVKEYIYARLLIDLDTMHPIKLYGLDMLFELLQDKKLSSKVKELYNFSYHDFIKLSYSVDPFNVSQLNDLKADVHYLQSENEKLSIYNEQLIADNEKVIESFTSSISWQLTKPMRAIRRLVTNPRIYLPVINNIIKKTPLLPLSRYMQQKYNSIRQYLASAPLSAQNIKYTNQTSQKRSKELMSERHISCVTSNIKLEELPDLDISIVTYNNGGWLERFSETLLAQGYPCEKLHLHFVDNGSKDDTVQKLEVFRQNFSDSFGSIEIYKRPNLGFGAGHDHAISHCKNDLFLVSNIDLEFVHDSLLNVVNYAINDSDNVACWELRQKPYEHPKYYDPITLETAWSSHACILIRKDAYEVVGGYEPRIFMYGEDVELSYRFRSYGYLLRYIPSAYVYHYTYDEANQVKPIQFTGSTLANALIRFRYGTTSDKLSAIVLQLALFIRGAGFSGSRKLVLGNFKKLAMEAKYFSSINKKDSTHFPFRYFDYEMIRDGAFYELNSPVRPSSELPLVTIITRTYREREFWLKECMASVINQTYPNIQHVIVEDGGETMSALVAEAKEAYKGFYNVEFAGFDKKGRSYTGNQGLEIAKGEYCLFLDDDDLVFPDHVEVLMNEIIASPELGAVYSLAWDVHTSVDKTTTPASYSEHQFKTLPLFYQEFCLKTLLNHNYIPIQAILFRKSLYVENGGFDESMDQLEDWNLWTKYALRSKFKFVPKTTSLFRTPFDEAERLRRVQNLDKAFNEAINKQKQLIG